MARLQRIGALALLVAALGGVLSGCGASSAVVPGGPVPLRTAQQHFDACEDALLAGELVLSAQSGLAVQSENGVTEVIWPFGYSATRESGGVVLRDETGKILVHEHQRVQMGGGLGANNVWAACAGSITEVSNVGG